MTEPYLRSPDAWRAALADHVVAPDRVVETGRTGSSTLRAGNIQMHSRYNPEEEARRLVESANLEEGRPVLVLGCGLGYHVLELLARGHEVIVIEPELDILKLAVDGPLAQAPCLIGAGCLPEADFPSALADFMAGRPHMLVHPPTAQLHREEVDAALGDLYAGALADKHLNIAVVGPMYGGSLPIAGYLARAFEGLGHQVRLIDHESAWPLYEKLQATVTGATPQGQLTSMYTNFLSEWTYAQVAEFNPEICIVLAQAPVAPNFAERLRKNGIVTAFWYVENWRHLPYWRDIAHYYDFFFHIQPGEFEAKLDEVGCRHHAYVQTACDSELHRGVTLSDEDRKHYGCDLSFAGAGYYNRVELFKGLSDYNFKIWGVNWTDRYVAQRLVDGESRFDSETFMKIVAASAINLNLHSSSSKPGVDPDCDAINPRVFEIAAAGGFQLCDPCIGLESLFDFDTELPVYRNLKELRERIDYFLAHPDERRAIAEAAQRRVLTEHTYEHRAASMLRHIYRVHGAAMLERGIRARHTIGEIKTRLDESDALRQWLEHFPEETPFTYDTLTRLSLQKGQGHL
jgi:spore maturation protein CgeB